MHKKHNIFLSHTDREVISLTLEQKKHVVHWFAGLPVCSSFFPGTLVFSHSPKVCTLGLRLKELFNMTVGIIVSANDCLDSCDWLQHTPPQTWKNEGQWRHIEASKAFSAGGNSLRTSDFYEQNPWHTTKDERWGLVKTLKVNFR